MKLFAKLFRASKAPVAPPDPFWSQFDHAYGTAEDVPALLARMTADWKDPVWGELWSRLCHQGSTYTASAAALPELISFASGLPPQRRIAPLSLASSIAADMAERRVPEAIRAPYRESLSHGQALSIEALHAPNLPDGHFVTYLQAYAAFRSYAPFALWLDAIADGEVELDCVGCDRLMWVFPSATAPHVTVEDSNAQTVLLPPIAPPPPEAEELQQLARAGGHSALAVSISLMYGQASCPACGSRFVPAFQRVDVDRGAA